MNKHKQELRAKLKAQRLAMSSQDRDDKSLAITEKLQAAVDWSQVSAIHVFEPIESLAEVDIRPFLDELTKSLPELGVYTSRKKDGAWHIYSVAADAPVPTASFDVILVPMLGFDYALHRIGYGGGYYDQLLASQPLAKKIGVCFASGKVDKMPTEDHDVALDMVITEVS